MIIVVLCEGLKEVDRCRVVNVFFTIIVVCEIHEKIRIGRSAHIDVTRVRHLWNCCVQLLGGYLIFILFSLQALSTGNAIFVVNLEVIVIVTR